MQVFEMTTVTEQALQNHKKECPKREALRQPWKTDIKSADATCLGKLFQVREAATATMATSVKV